MPDSAGKTEKSQTFSVRKKIFLTRLSLLVEGAARAWLAPAILVGLYAGLALFGVFAKLPEGAQNAALLLLVLVLAALAGKGSRHGGIFFFPSEMDALRRLELASQTRHRPLATLRDAPAGLAQPDETQNIFWALHLQQLKQSLPRVRVPWPRPRLAEQDPMALRFSAILLVAAGWVFAGDAAEERLARAFTPRPVLAGKELSLLPDIAIWINPPAYTGLAPFTLPLADGDGDGDGGEGNALAIPVNSKVTARLGGKFFLPPRLVIAGAEHRFSSPSKNRYMLETTATLPELSPLTSSPPPATAITLMQGPFATKTWPVVIVPDHAPALALEEALPGTGQAPVLALRYRARDDYGLTRLEGRVFPSAMAQGLAAGMAADERGFALPLPPALTGTDTGAATGAGTNAVADTGVQETRVDLSSHPLAGLPVILVLEGEDAAGQVVQSAPLEIVLPAREFHHPLARALAEERKTLVWQGDPVRAQVSARVAAIHQILIETEKPRTVLSLLLSSAEKRLSYDGSKAALSDVQAMLWQAALLIEDGDFLMASQNVQDAINTLSALLQDPEATDAEIDFAVYQLQQALTQYLGELSQKMQQAMQQGDPAAAIPPEMMDRIINGSAFAGLFQDFLRLRDAQDRAGARKALEQLSDIVSRIGQEGLSSIAPEQQKMLDWLQKLENIDTLQQALTRRTEKTAQARRGDENFGTELPKPDDGTSAIPDTLMSEMPPFPEAQPPSQSPMQQQELSRLGRQQNAIRKMLGETMREADALLGGIPETLGQAEQSMREAETALEAGDAQDAVMAQNEALAALRQAQQDALQQAQEILQGMMAMMVLGGENADGRDPFGRQPGSHGRASPFTKVKVPQEAEIRKIREILDTLRERANDPARPEKEQDYLDRLLKQF